MNRLTTTLKMDFKLQARYGFYYAAAFVTLVWIAILLALPAAFLPLAVPLIIFTDLGIVGMIFIAGQVVFEKTEGTIYAINVTPVTFGEYLAGKLLSLTILAWIISLVVVLAVYGTGAYLFFLTIGIILTSLIGLLVGLIAVAPYNSISRFIMPAQLYLLIMNLPLIDYFGWYESWLVYLIPTQGSLILLKGAFVPEDTWLLVYAVLYQAVWVGILVVWARKRFEKYIVAQKGGRA
ncbi:putative antibiotic-transport integral membrane leucine and valine rich protein abc transporter [hydrocarbon metagenome]|uniref:Putative antibiotic-transport integral membrane leucine and valine rich protein abc transporter n=1 Tax=hydrocarbon metagenome TaxID=938273 RepID=A0A0W8E1T8_9ZZZZ